MKLCVVGTGYVGLVAGACFADFGNEVVGADIDEAKIARLRAGEIPIYEPGLEEMVKLNAAEGRLTFTTDVGAAVAGAEVVFIAVGTPPLPDGSADLSHIWTVARTIGRHATGFTVVVDKSTVPVGTAQRVQAILEEHGPGKDFAVVANPEFLKEGDAIADFLKPARVVLGTDDPRALEKMRYLYAPFVRRRDDILTMDPRSAELAKYACNAMLATRISFMNEIARLCSAVGADVQKVRVAMAWDDRIGPRFLFPGVGYGGSCFPKDVKALRATGEEHGVPLRLMTAVEEVNEAQKGLLAEMALAHLGDPAGKVAALWGLAFKPNTDDVREAPALTICRRLLDAGVALRLHDPVARESFARELPAGDRVVYCDSPYEAAEGADALLLCTEWHVYRRPDFDRLRAIMRAPALFDGRNQWDPEFCRGRGFHYEGIGRP